MHAFGSNATASLFFQSYYFYGWGEKSGENGLTAIPHALYLLFHFKVHKVATAKTSYSDFFLFWLSFQFHIIVNDKTIASAQHKCFYEVILFPFSFP